MMNPDRQTAEQGGAMAAAILDDAYDDEVRREQAEYELSERGKERAREMTEGTSEAYHQGYEAHMAAWLAAH